MPRKREAEAERKQDAAQRGRRHARAIRRRSSNTAARQRTTESANGRRESGHLAEHRTGQRGMRETHCEKRQVEREQEEPSDAATGSPRIAPSHQRSSSVSIAASVSHVISPGDVIGRIHGRDTRAT